MYRFIITITLITNLTACVIPVSSSCSGDRTFDNANSGFPPKGQDCSELDAVVYLASALYKEAQKNPEKKEAIRAQTNENPKCSELIGKSQKECLRKENASYDPLDEL